MAFSSTIHSDGLTIYKLYIGLLPGHRASVTKMMLKEGIYSDLKSKELVSVTLTFSDFAWAFGSTDHALLLKMEAPTNIFRNSKMNTRPFGFKL